jgi:hypothetical protein
MMFLHSWDIDMIRATLSIALIAGVLSAAASTLASAQRFAQYQECAIDRIISGDSAATARQHCGR